MATSAPLAQAESLAGTKKDLVEKVKALATDNFWINRLRSEQGWSRLSNAKLMRLHTILTDAQKRFGSRAEIIAALADAEGHGKDGDFKKSRESWPLPRLMDALHAAEHRVKVATRVKKPSTRASRAAAKPVATATKPASSVAKPAGRPTAPAKPTKR